MEAAWNGDTTADAICLRCNSPVLPGSRFCDTCGAATFIDPDDAASAGQDERIFIEVTQALGLLWRWILRGRDGVRYSDGKEAWKLLKRARKMALRRSYYVSSMT